MASRTRSRNATSGFVLGRTAFEKISAVEGIRPTLASRARAAEFDCSALSPEERRRAIIEAHRPERRSRD
jgi:hypothetical protein